MTAPFKILFVCTGNICRSPMAEQMLAQKLNSRNIKTVHVSSAGVFAMVGDSITPQVATALTAVGYTPTDHKARQTTADILEAADLILTATQEHRSEVVRTFTRANRKTFTIKEFANLAHYSAHPDPDIEIPASKDLQDKLEITSMARGYAPELANYDIADPYMLSQEVFNGTRDELEPLLESIADWVANG